MLSHPNDVAATGIQKMRAQCSSYFLLTMERELAMNEPLNNINNTLKTKRNS
jgi:hypothetical protein